MKISESLFPQINVKQAVYTRVEGTAPWGMDFIAYRHVKFGIVTRGQCFIDLKNGQSPIKLSKGSCYLLTRGDAFRIRDELNSLADDFEPLLEKLDGRILRHGGGGSETTIIGGRFIFNNDAPPPILDLLPAMIHFTVDDDELTSLQSTIQLLANEIKLSDSGLMINRLTEIFFIQSLRAYLFSDKTDELDWRGIVTDAQLVKALQIIHDDYAQKWTIDKLAKHVGMSRAVFAARFKTKLGMTPIAYLLRFRIYQAQELLNQGNVSIAQVASRVGYESESAFHKAFKRQTGISPGSFKKQEENNETLISG